MDLNLHAKLDVPKWSETRWNGCYCPESGAGVFIHAGRLRGHLEWWWVQTAVYLPDGRLAVDRSWVRNPAEDGLRTPTLDLRITDDGWQARFDGIVELTTPERLSRAAGGSAAPNAPLQFDITAWASRPKWDLYSSGSSEHDFAGDMHFEQAIESTGFLTLGRETHSLDGLGYYDHSAGVRDWSGWSHHHFVFGIMPGFTFNAIRVLAEDGSPAREPIGVWITEDGDQLPLTEASMPALEDLVGAPHKFEYLLAAEGLEPMPIQVEILHAFPCQITAENDNINGIDWQVAGDPLVLVECMARLTQPDGAVGYGHIERSLRRSAARLVHAGHQRER